MTQAKAPADLFSKEELTLYSRHLILPDVGLDGQAKLKNARVLVVGTGGLGSPILLYLGAAGVGTLGIVDFDFVDETNLQRQVIHGKRDVGRPKVASAADRIKALNPHITVESHNLRLSADNALDLLGRYDIVVDGTDNFATRYLLNDACALLKKPLIYGSIFRFEGQATIFDAANGPCLRCLFPEPPPPELSPSCGEGGVLGVLPGLIGCIQATEVIKWIVGIGQSLSGRLLVFDGLSMRFREMKLRKDPACPLCGEAPTLHGLIDYEDFCGLKSAEDLHAIPELSPRDLQALMRDDPTLDIVDIREKFELAMGALPNVRHAWAGQLLRGETPLDPSRTTVLVCKVGERSAYIASRLLKDGYGGKLFNLKGGMNAWATDIDPSLALY